MADKQMNIAETNGTNVTSIGKIAFMNENNACRNMDIMKNF